MTNSEMNKIRAMSEVSIRNIRRKITAEQAINAAKRDKTSTWGKILSEWEKR